MNLILTILNEIWQVTLSMAPYLLFGFLMAGILSKLISKEFIRRHLGGRNWVQSLKAALVGVPMPICSCGVIPLAASLREHGASRGATASFLASTPQTGIDSLMITYALLGLPFAIFRAVVAFVSGILCGTAVEAVTSARGEELPTESIQEAKKTRETPIDTLRQMFHYGFIALPRNISKAMIFGIILSGIISSLIPENYFADKMGDTWIAMLLMLAIGLPLYVCSSASVPIALAFITAGISPGAALVFLIVGPATNAATITTLWKVIGKKQVAVFLTVMTLTALGAGLVMNQLPLQAEVSEYACRAHEEANVWQYPAAVILLIILIHGSTQSWRKSQS